MENKAEYQIVSFVNEGILEIVVKGKLITSAIEELENKVVDIIKAKGAKKVLVDSHAINATNSIIENYIAVRRPIPTELKVNVAFVGGPENMDNAFFLEVTALNAGLPLKCFTDMDVAREWLKSMS
jgi:hypothetical protein